jgi:glucose-6-phosphate 1-epimerase
MPDIAALNTHFGVSETITFRRGPGECAVVDITHPQATAQLALQGAHLLTWVPQDEEPVIWLSPTARYAAGHPIRGGIPICWPWFGPHPSHPDFPAHGFARTSPWIVEAARVTDDEVQLRLRLLQTEQTEALWPHACSLSLALRIGRTLRLELVTHNIGVKPVTVSEALHTYFKVKDSRHTRVLGLDGGTYIDKVDGARRKQQSGPIGFSAETDRIYLDSTAECMIEDPGFGRRIRVSKSGSASTVVWNPWQEQAAAMSDFEPLGYLDMVCVESANAADNALTIAPGESHRLSVCFRTERLD